MQVNVNVIFMFIQVLFFLLFKSDVGLLVFILLSVGRQGRVNWGVYVASKFVIEGMMQVLVDEYQQRLRVNCINLGGTRIVMRVSVFSIEDLQKFKIFVDIMSFYFWLMGDDSRRKIGMIFDV